MKIRILYIYIVIFFASCNEKNNDEKQIFRYNEHSNISSLDPAFAKNILFILEMMCISIKINVLHPIALEK